MSEKLACVVFLAGVMSFGTISSGQHQFTDIGSLSYPDQAASLDQSTHVRQREIINERVNQMRTSMSMTYGGNIVFHFPNYDIAINGTPAFAGQGNGVIQNRENAATRERSSVRVIWKSDQGSSWDGANFFLSPNYAYDTYADQLYTQRIIGQPNKGWNLSKRDDIWPFGRNVVKDCPPMQPRSSIPALSKSQDTIDKMYFSSANQFHGNWSSPPRFVPMKTERENESKLEIDEMETPEQNDRKVARTSSSTISRNSPELRRRANPSAGTSVATRASARTDNRSVNAMYLDALRKAASEYRPFE